MIRLLIADDHAMVREGLKRLIEDWSDIEIVAEAADGEETVRKCREHPVDVLLLDISMPGPGFFETLRRTHRDCPEIKILVLSVHPEDEYALYAFRAGAVGYLTKDRTPEELAQAIRWVHAGHNYVTESLADTLVTELQSDPERRQHELLSNREFQIMCLLGSGKSASEIAESINLSPKTVSTYRTRILSKLNMSSTMELMRYVIKHDLNN